jgi:cellobiose phosphorylase
LGIKPDYEGLFVNPCIPKDWKGFTAQRQFRGADYTITVKNPSAVSQGVAELWVNGVKQKGKHIPLAKAGSKVDVEVILG